MINLRNLNVWRVLERGSGVLSRWGFRRIAGRWQQRPSGPASIVETSGDAVTSGSLEGVITGWNQGAERLYGYSAEEAVGRTIWEIMNPLGGPGAVSRNINEVRRGGEVGPFDAVHHDRNGKLLHVSVLLSPIKDPAGQVIGVSAINRDITERKEVEEKLWGSEQRFRALLRNAPGVIAILEPDNTVRYDSPAIERVLGYRSDERIGNKCRDYTHPDDVESVNRAFVELLDKPGSRHSLEYKMRHADGSWRYVETVCSNLLNDPAVRGVVVNYRDVTERREAEEKLRKSEASLAEAQRISNLGNWEWNVKTGEVSWSDEVYRIYGFAPREIIPTLDKLMERVHPDDRELLRRAINGALYEYKPYDLEHRIVRPDGVERVVHCRAEVAFDENGEPLRMLGTVHDITGHKRAEEALRESEERFRTAFENAPVGVAFVSTDDMRYLRVNCALCEMLGYSEEELLEKTSPEITHPGDHEISEDLASRALGGEFESYDLERRYLHGDGHLAWNLTNVSLIRNSRGEPSYFVCLHQDITERKVAEEALRESEERFRTAFEDAPIGVALVGLDRRYLKVNRALCEMLGYSEEELLAMTSREITHPDDLKASADRTRRALEKGAGSSYLEKRYMHADGHIVWALSSVSLVRDSRGEPDYFVALFQNIMERKALEERLEHQVLHDPLTGLANRTLFMDRLEQALARLDRRDKPIAVLFVDLDDFKLVNDSLGHEVGDRLLVEVAGRLRECVRPEDTVARLGGDEFVILLEGISDLGDARRVAERAVSSVEVPFCFEGHEVFVGTSIGIAPASEAPDEPEDLLRNADMALYRAKHRGKARYEFFDESMSNEALERLELESTLRKALGREEFRVYYQPKISMATGRIVSLEALVRWEHPERGLLEPREFLPAAEKTGLIVPLGEWVLCEVCHQGREWQERFAGQSPPRVCTNVSSRQFLQTDLVGEVAGALRESGMKAQGLSLEIPEGVLMDDAETNVEKLTTLKDLGVHIVIDDFGTAFSSLSYLKNFPLNFLKIDRSLIVKLGEKPEDEAIVRAMIGLAHALGWAVTAQGVENEEQLDLLRELGCNIVQGYYFTRPVTSAEATDLLEENFSTTISP